MSAPKLYPPFKVKGSVYFCVVDARGEEITKYFSRAKANLLVSALNKATEQKPQPPKKPKDRKLSLGWVHLGEPGVYQGDTWGCTIGDGFCGLLANYAHPDGSGACKCCWRKFRHEQS
jgi:hypothetical protein